MFWVIFETYKSQVHVKAGSDTILGATIVGPNAGDMVRTYPLHSERSMPVLDLFIAQTLCLIFRVYYLEGIPSNHLADTLRASRTQTSFRF